MLTSIFGILLFAAACVAGLAVCLLPLTAVLGLLSYPWQASDSRDT